MNHEPIAVDLPTVSAALWITASRRLLREVGRARMHDLRSNLNLATLGLELLDDDSNETSSIRRAVGGAEQNVAGLDALILETTEPAVRRLPDALGWAIEATAPVANRRGLEVSPPAQAADLAAIELPRGAGAILGYALVEVYLDAGRQSACRITPGDGDGPGVTVEWTPAEGESGQGPDDARAALEELLDGLGTVALTSSHGGRRLVLEFPSSRSQRA